MDLVASTTAMMSVETGIFLLFFTIMIMGLFLLVLYMLYPTSHKDTPY